MCMWICAKDESGQCRHTQSSWNHDSSPSEKSYNQLLNLKGGDDYYWFHTTTGPIYLIWLILMAKYIHTNSSG